MAVKPNNPAAVALGRKGGKKGGPARAAAPLHSKGSETTPPTFDTSKKALHACLKRIKDAKDDNELRRLTEELQKIVFYRQYRNAEN